MPEIKLIRNGAKKVANKKRSVKRRRRNPATATTTTTKKRNGTTKAGALSFAKKNGLKLVSRTAVNGRKKSKRGKRRNGVAVRKASNGMFGNSKETAMSVISLLGGLAITKVESSILTPVAQNALGVVGLGGFAKPIIEAGLAMTVNKYVADSIKKGSGKFVMYGGLAMAVMSLVEQFLPQTSAYNPFASGNSTPLVLNQPNIVDARALTAQANPTATMGRPRGLPPRPRMAMNYRTPRFTY